MVIGAQNLVPNWSFEDTIPNPTWTGWITDCADWQTAPPGNAGYVNDLDPFFPGVASLYHVPHTGTAWAVLYTFVRDSCANCRSVIQVQLLDTLQQGKRYCVSFFVSVFPYSNYACNNWGALFSPVGVMNSNAITTMTPSINNDPATNPLLSDSTWIEVSGSFIANGDESYIVLGNFNNDATSDTVYRGVHQQGNDFAMYIIDDVSVEEVKPCIAGVNDTICSGGNVLLGALPSYGVSYNWQPSLGLSDPTTSNPIASPSVTTTYILTQTQCDVVSHDTVTIVVIPDCGAPYHSATMLFPNPTDGNAFCSYDLDEGGILEVYNMLGQVVFSQSLPAGHRKEAVFFSFDAGLYAWQIRSGQVVYTGKIEVVR